MEEESLSEAANLARWQTVGGNALRKEYVGRQLPAHLLNVLVLEFKLQNMETDKRYLVDVEKLQTQIRKSKSFLGMSIYSS